MENDSLEVLKTKEALQDHINLVRTLTRIVACDLLLRGDIHDSSKASPEELYAFTEYAPKLRTCTYGSDEYEKYRAALGPALAHHYSSNRHHPEHHEQGVRGMNLIDIVEMFCDWLASTKRHNDGDIYRSIETNQKRFGMSDDLVGIFKNTADLLKDSI